MYFDGFPRQLIKKMLAEVRRVEKRNKAKPFQFARPRIPAAAPAKQAERNLMLVKDPLASTFWGYMSWAACSDVDIAVQR